MTFISPPNTTANTSPRHIMGASIKQSPYGTGHIFNKPLGPFAVLCEVREPLKPKNKSSNGWERLKAKKLADAARQTAAIKTAKVLRVNKFSEIGLSTVGACDRAAQIGRTAI